MLKAEEIYKSINSFTKEDFEDFIAASKTEIEKNFWIKIQEYICNEKTRPKIIYHYTNLSALEGILSEGKLRLLRSDNMNDRAEMSNFIDLLEKAVCKRLESRNMNSATRVKFSEERFKRKQDIAYIASFSTWKDDVSQWERYGNSGYGVAIAFDYKILRNFAKHAGVMLQEAFYGDNVNEHKLVDVLEDLFLDNDYVRHGFMKGDWDAVFDNAWAISVAHKHYSFASEQEHRLVTLPIWNGERYDELGNAITVCTPSAIKECINFDWRQRCDDNNIPIDKLIVGIIIGPRSRVTCSELKRYLKNIGLDSLAKRVTKSKSTLK